jgi:hypothetical protein
MLVSLNGIHPTRAALIAAATYGQFAHFEAHHREQLAEAVMQTSPVVQIVTAMEIMADAGIGLAPHLLYQLAACVAENDFHGKGATALQIMQACRAWAGEFDAPNP